MTYENDSDQRQSPPRTSAEAAEIGNPRQLREIHGSGPHSVIGAPALADTDVQPQAQPAVCDCAVGRNRLAGARHALHCPVDGREPAARCPDCDNGSSGYWCDACCAGDAAAGIGFAAAPVEFADSGDELIAHGIEAAGQRVWGARTLSTSEPTPALLKAQADHIAEELAAAIPSREEFAPAPCDDERTEWVLAAMPSAPRANLPSASDLDSVFGPHGWTWHPTRERWAAEVCGEELEVWLGRTVHVSFGGDVYGHDPESDTLPTIAAELLEHFESEAGHWADLAAAIAPYVAAGTRAHVAARNAAEAEPSRCAHVWLDAPHIAGVQCCVGCGEACDDYGADVALGQSAILAVSTTGEIAALEPTPALAALLADNNAVDLEWGDDIGPGLWKWRGNIRTNTTYEGECGERECVESELHRESITPAVPIVAGEPAEQVIALEDGPRRRRPVDCGVPKSGADTFDALEAIAGDCARAGADSPAGPHAVCVTDGPVDSNGDLQ